MVKIGRSSLSFFGASWAAVFMAVLRKAFGSEPFNHSSKSILRLFGGLGNVFPTSW